MTRLARTLLSLAFAALVLAPVAFSPAARADELQDIGALLKSGQQAQALERVNKYLVAKPKDAQGRFLKGLILAEQNKSAEAIEVFTKLSQDYPELPEPYNNVAVLYASQGQYEKARQALESSIRTHPAYATAYENLGDVYTKLASQAYDKALQIDSSNATAKSKLALMTELISNTGTPKPRSAVNAPAPSAAPSATSRVAEGKVPTPPAAVAQAPSAPAAQSPSAPVAATPPTKATPEPKAARAEGEGSDEVLRTVRGWARAWESKEVGTYLAYYGAEFRPPNGESRAKWEAGRRTRIAAPRKIEVEIGSPKVTLHGANAATVVFRQGYRSDSLKVNSTKTLIMARQNGKWQIREERVGR